MRISLVLSPFMLLLAPLILVVLASFTTFAVFTSLLALVVVWIRLGFLVVEFSGGVMLDILGWGKRKWANTEQKTRVKVSKGDGTKDIKSVKHHSKRDHHYTSQQLKQKQLYQVAAAKVNMWEVDPLFMNLNIDEKLRNDMDGDGDYFMLTDGINTKRPQGRRIRSGYV